MKTLFVLRHAKTQSDAPNGDFPRELVERGHREAEQMGQYLREHAGAIDRIVSSDARRAQQTAELVDAQLEPPAPLSFDHGIYDAGLDELVHIVRGLPDEAASVVIVGHNPGFFDLIVWLVGEEAAPEKLPTAGLAQIEFNVDRWDDVAAGAGRLADYQTPRLLR